GKLDEESWSRVLYYLVRDVAGYGPLDPLMRDPNIEDISCNGLHKLIFVWHRKYESIPTNIGFNDERVYNDFIIKLAHKGSKHISSATPILDATLPEKHRMAATFQKEVSTHGSSFCIRKFREEPLSIIDLIRFGTLSPEIAAYFWMLLENRMNFMILGGTGAGKTSMLNALLSLIPPNNKIITVEEVAELNPPHGNWVQLVGRKGFGFGTMERSSITLFDLVKLSLRYRPDYIVVGEVRGEEAFTLFQAIATGHGGICTMHADSLDHAVKRLTSEPMNISKIYIPLMNVAMYISRVELPHEREGLKYGRRVRAVWEIDDFEKYITISSWDPTNDTFKVDLKQSVKLKQISDLKGDSFENTLDELERRAKLLTNMAKVNVTNQGEVVNRIQEYIKTGQYELFQKGRPDSRLEESIITIKGRTYKVWRYPKGAMDPLTGRKIGGRIVKRGE
ncbi:MAG: type II/IV secretion system ATPase subunit, partial [Candidatus Bathyarchaeia archaeon]